MPSCRWSGIRNRSYRAMTSRRVSVASGVRSSTTYEPLGKLEQSMEVMVRPTGHVPFPSVSNTLRPAASVRQDHPFLHGQRECEEDRIRSRVWRNRKIERSAIRLRDGVRHRDDMCCKNTGTLRRNGDESIGRSSVDLFHDRVPDGLSSLRAPGYIRAREIGGRKKSYARPTQIQRLAALIDDP